MCSQKIVSTDAVVCIVGGSRVDPELIGSIFPFVNKYVAVDSGADRLLEANIEPLCVVGDLDSLSDHARATFADRLCHISEQNSTDFEKAVSRVAAPVILAVGFNGGRMDHTLAVLNVMARFSNRAVVLVDADEVSFVARAGRTTIPLPDDTPISLMPLSDVRATASGLRWSFADQDMHPVGFISSSNIVAGGPVVVDVVGPLLITLPRAHLPVVLQAVVREG